MRIWRGFNASRFEAEHFVHQAAAQARCRPIYALRVSTAFVTEAVGRGLQLEGPHVRLRAARHAPRAKTLPCERSLNVKQTLGSVNVKQTLRFFMNTKLTFSPRVNVKNSSIHLSTTTIAPTCAAVPCLGSSRRAHASACSPCRELAARLLRRVPNEAHVAVWAAMPQMTPAR